MKILRLPLADLQPSQLYISAEKLARVQASFDPTRPKTMQPVPVKQLDGRLVLTDGHTRSLAALLAGLGEVPAVWDTDELDWEAYRICVAWCLEAGITSVERLRSRIVDAEAYERLWHERCRQMQADLARQRGEAG
jgi:hypothetical protein